MIVKVRLFAAARQLASAECVQVDLPEESTVADLRQALVKTQPQLAPLLAHTRFAVNAEYASDQQRVDSQDDVACIPPVSGG